MQVPKAMKRRWNLSEQFSRKVGIKMMSELERWKHSTPTISTKLLCWQMHLKSIYSQTQRLIRFCPNFTQVVKFTKCVQNGTAE